MEHKKQELKSMSLYLDAIIQNKPALAARCLEVPLVTDSGCPDSRMLSKSTQLSEGESICLSCGDSERLAQWAFFSTT
jgi:hypothetical protein